MHLSSVAKSPPPAPSLKKDAGSARAMMPQDSQNAHPLAAARTPDAARTSENPNLVGTSRPEAVGPPSAKDAFLKKIEGMNPLRADKYGKQLNNKQLARLVEHYRRKHGIEIYINGEVDPQNLLRMQKWHFQNNAKDLLDIDKHADKGLLLLQRFLCEPMASKVLDPYRKPNEYGFPKGHDDELREIVKKDDRLAARLDELFMRDLAKAANNAKDRGPEEPGARSELLELSRDTKSSSFRGYLFGSGTLRAAAHIDTYVVTPLGKIICAIPYRGNLSVPEMYRAEIIDFSIIARPQGGSKECAALGLVYLKEYLKDDAFQLRNRTLLIDTTYDGKTIKFHLPSPQVLEYSQSSTYAKAILAMVAGKEGGRAASHLGRPAIPTFEEIMDSGGVITHPGTGEVMTQEQLAEFSSAWIADYKETSEKRKRFDLYGDTANRNLRLTYTLERYNKKVLPDVPGAASPEELVETFYGQTSPLHAKGEVGTRSDVLFDDPSTHRASRPVR